MVSVALIRWDRCLARAAVAAVLSLMPLVGFAQTTTRTVLVNIWSGSPSCSCELLPATHSYDFIDPLARQWDSLSVVFDAGFEANQAAVTDLTVEINGQQVGSPAAVNNPTDPFCGGLQPYTFTAPSMLPGYHTGGHNTLTISWKGWMCYSIPGDAQLTFTYPPVHPIEFNVTDDPLREPDRHVILTNTEAGYLYPRYQGIGGQDKMVPMYVRTFDSTTGAPQSGQTVYLRVIDPPDPAPYKNQPGKVLSRVNDNDGPSATLAGSAIAPAATPGVYQGTSGANGELDFTLLLDPRAEAGDNYQVEASFSEFFPAGMTWKSGALTAWKRMFIETLHTLRNGIPLIADAAQGSPTIHVADDHYGGNRGKHRIAQGDLIVLVHAPARDRRNILYGWYREEHSVADITADSTGFVVTLGTRAGHIITPEQLQHDFGRDPSDPNTPVYSDWIAWLSGATLGAADYFDADSLLVWGSGSPFNDAFVEYWLLPNSPFGFVPLPHFGAFDDTVLQSFAKKWSFTGAGTAAAPNHQLLMIADNDGSTSPDAGRTTTKVIGETSSWVWRGTIDGTVRNGRTAVTDAEAWAEKTVAHEIAHQWQTDGTFNLLDHCPADTPTYDDPALVCLLAAPDATAQDQRANGVARFHLISVQPTVGPPYYHSEYFGIRTRSDPFVP